MVNYTLIAGHEAGGGAVDFSLTEDHEAIRDAVRELCAQFPDAYWRELDRQKAYPDAFVGALTESGWLSALIPVEFGGAGSVSPRPPQSSKRSISPAATRQAPTPRCIRWPRC